MTLKAFTNGDISTPFPEHAFRKSTSSESWIEHQQICYKQSPRKSADQGL